MAITLASLLGMIGLSNVNPIVVSSFANTLSRTYQSVYGGRSNESKTTTTHDDKSFTDGKNYSVSDTDSKAKSEV